MKQQPVVTAEELKKYVIQKDSELESDANARLNGVKNSISTGYVKAGYQILRKFYDGDHYETSKDKNRNQRIYNYCRTIVDNYVSLLAPPEIIYNAEDITNPFEKIRAQTIQGIIDTLNRVNDFKGKFRLASLNSSLLGDGFIIGPFIKTAYQGEKIVKTIAFETVRRPEHIRVIWADDNFDIITGFILHSWVSKNQAEKIFAKEIKEQKIVLNTSQPSLSGVLDNTIQPNQMVEIKQYYDDTYHLTLLDNYIIRFTKHNWGFVPILYIPANIHPYYPWGISDIEDILDPQTEYNDSVSLSKDIINLNGIPPVFAAGTKLGALDEIKAGDIQVVDVGENGKVFSSPFNANMAEVMNYHLDRKQNIMDISMINELFYGGSRLERMSGRGLSVLMQPINKKIIARQERWTKALKRLYANTLHLLELEMPSAKNLIQGKYNVDIFFKDVFTSSVVDEINKFNAKIQSLYTTMKNLEIDNPDEEIARMKQEYTDPALAAEISRNPQFQMQLRQGGFQEQSQQQNPLLTEEDNQPEEGEGVVTTKGQQSPSSAQGAVNLNNFRR